MTNELQTYIDENCHYLSFDQIEKMDKHDNGPIMNVINRFEKHCYGIWLLNDDLDENYILFYINGTSQISGLSCRMNIHNKKRNELTFAFAKIINDEYSADTDLLDIFNTFQHQTRTLLEKLNYFTYGNEIAGKKGTIMVKNKVGIDYIPFLKKDEAFKSLFVNIHRQTVDTNSKENWIYLMFNPRNSYTKIGRSINPRAREKTLQGEDPENQIIAYWKVPKSIEIKLHRKYESKQIRGEWFQLSISDLIEIREFMTEITTSNNGEIPDKLGGQLR